MTEKTGSDLNFREIRVTETGIHLDDQRIPIFALGPDVIVGSSVLGSQTITLTIHADRVVFAGKAEARVELPTSDGSNPDAYPLRGDETIRTGEHRVSETYSHLERDPEYLGVEDRTPTSRPAGFATAGLNPNVDPVKFQAELNLAINNVEMARRTYAPRIDMTPEQREALQFYPGMRPE